MKRVVAVSLAVVVSLLLVAVAQPQTANTFTYQGRLTQGASPASGSYDFEFGLFDAASLGSQLGGTLSRPGVSVSSGLFTVALDFGPGAFGEQRRWIEISVRPAGGGAFTTLLPRQELTSVPKAAYAVTARTINGLACSDGDSPRWNGGSWTCAAGGTVTNVATGPGLSGGPVTGTGTIAVAPLGITSGMIAASAVGLAQIDPAQVQARVNGLCPTGQYMRGINPDGTVLCEAPTPAPTPTPTPSPTPSPGTTSEQIAAARAAADGPVSLPVAGATVTYVKPGLGSDPVGFTIQAESTGPALFVAVDPASLVPAPATGDVVSFTITSMATLQQLRMAAAVTGFSRLSTGANVDALVQDISAVSDVVTALGAYESELVDVTGSVTGAFVPAGAAFEQAPIATAGIAGSPDLRLRVPSAVRAAIGLVPGCGFTLNNVPIGRFNGVVQLPAYVAGDISLSGCPALSVVSAVATSSTSVQVTFSRTVLASSVAANGSQFAFDNGLTAAAASTNGAVVTVTTSSQAPGTNYTVTVASSVTDPQGAPLGPPDSAMFGGFMPAAVVRINELNASISDSCDLIELRVISGGSLDGYVLRERDTNPPLVTFSGGFTVATNDIIVVHMNAGSSVCNPGGATQETSSVTQQQAATFPGNYDTAFDWWSSDAGLTNTDNVFTLYDSFGSIMDAVFVADAPTGTAAAATEAQAALVAAAGHWQMVGGGIPPGGFIDADFRLHAALDLNATGTTATGTTIQRLDNTDDNDKDDWNSGGVTTQAPTWGALNAGQTLLP